MLNLSVLMRERKLLLKLKYYNKIFGPESDTYHHLFAERSILLYLPVPDLLSGRLQNSGHGGSLWLVLKAVIREGYFGSPHKREMTGLLSHIQLVSVSQRKGFFFFSNCNLYL